MSYRLKIKDFKIKQISVYKNLHNYAIQLPCEVLKTNSHKMKPNPTQFVFWGFKADLPPSPKPLEFWQGKSPNTIYISGAIREAELLTNVHRP